VHEKNATNKRIHDAQTIKVHDRELEWFHPNFSLIHPGNQKIKYHNQVLYTEQVHKGKEWKHRLSGFCSKYLYTKTESGSRVCPKCGSGNFSCCTYHSESWVSTWECRKCHRDIKAPCTFFHCASCCDRDGHSGGTFVKGCRGMFDYSCGDGSIATREIPVYEDRSLCCDRPRGSGGCEERCLSCDKEISTIGCTEKKYYLCCKADPNNEDDTNHKGCRDLWKCCQKDVLSATTGCKLACCKNDLGVKGCKQQYSCCKKPYEAGKERENGCKNEWTCCKTLEPSDGCKLKWSCCDAIVSLNNPDDEEKACQQVCKACDEKWGESKGCTLEETHDFEKSQSCGDETKQEFE